MQEYNYWGSGKNEPPSNLKTKKQLAEMGLSPVNPVGFIETRKYTIQLYNPEDLSSARPKRKPTESQLANLRKGRAAQKYRAWYRQGGFIEEDRADIVKAAKQIISESNWLILDTETTGINSAAEAVEIAIINHTEILINTLIKPTVPIQKEASEIHGITDEMVRDAPLFKDIYAELKKIIDSKIILIYNADFDMKILSHCCKIYKLPELSISYENTVCMMEYYAQWSGEYSSYWEDYKWQKLPYGGHRSLDDCFAVLNILKVIAGDDPNPNYPDFS